MLSTQLSLQTFHALLMRRRRLSDRLDRPGNYHRPASLFAGWPHDGKFDPRFFRGSHSVKSTTDNIDLAHWGMALFALIEVAPNR
jgi:hypothetical protein